jgi:hypothetical protein
MGRGIVAKLRANLEQAGKELLDTWRDGHDLKYHLLCAIGWQILLKMYEK